MAGLVFRHHWKWIWICTLQRPFAWELYVHYTRPCVNVILFCVHHHDMRTDMPIVKTPFITKQFIYSRWQDLYVNDQQTTYLDRLWKKTHRLLQVYSRTDKFCHDASTQVPLPADVTSSATRKAVNSLPSILAHHGYGALLASKAHSCTHVHVINCVHIIVIITTYFELTLSYRYYVVLLMILSC